MGLYTSIQVKPIGFEGDQLIPAVSSDSTINFLNNEQIIASFTADNVKIMGHKSTGEWACDYGMEYIPERNAWDILITNERVAVISKYIPSFFSGKAVEKNGKVSVGQIEIKNIGELEIDTNSKPSLLSLYYKRCDGAGLYFIIEAPLETLENIKSCIKSVSAS